jgi:hypothetical protein
MDYAIRESSVGYEGASTMEMLIWKRVSLKNRRSLAIKIALAEAIGFVPLAFTSGDLHSLKIPSRGQLRAEFHEIGWWVMVL